MTEPSRGAVTELLRAAAGGSRDASDRLFDLVYDELKQVARGRLPLERPGHTLNTTALVHEAWFKLVGQSRIEWASRNQFFAVASEAMRRILVDHARHRRRLKRGAGTSPLPLEAADDLRQGDWFTADEAEELIVLDEVLHKLAETNRDGATVVHYRFFGGLSLAEVGAVMGTSERTARRSWTAARAWLARELDGRIGRRDGGLLRAEADPVT